ncbi:hypothetical protein ACFOGJ_18805 [Marinibaculum pumilum]|uniref:Uncharacterized protein n=1 Tax=Marinibaculum pumilum TaxID=1766165 RepID=A0ABV7L433_9PROT
MPDGGPLRRMVGGISAVMVIVWTLLCLAFYALIELLGNLLVWLSRSVFEAQGLADFFAGVFGFLQDLGFVTIAVIWLIGVILAVGFNLVTHRATRDAEARWSQRRGDKARTVGTGSSEPPPSGPAGGGSAGGGSAGGGGTRAGKGGKGAKAGAQRPVTIDLHRDGDTYR